MKNMDEKRPNPESTRPGVPDPYIEDDGDEATAELVAFLDGELDQPANEAVEAKISLDPTTRAEADALKKTWDLLDYLPRSEPSPNFTERTMSRIEPVRESGTAESKNGPLSVNSGPTLPRLSTSSTPTMNLPQRKSIGRRLGVGACWILASALAGFIGYFTRSQITAWTKHMEQQEQDAKILSEQRLLQNLHHYRQIDDFEFLKELDSPDLFGEEHPVPASEAAP
jgi:hypothetical protein